MTFDLFQSVNGVGIPCPTDRLMATIDCQKIRDRVAAVRAAVAAGQKDEASRLKKRLPAVTWQAHFEDGKRRNESALHSGLYMLDIDGVEDVEHVCEQIMETATEQCLLDQLVAVHISPSGRGIRVVAVCTDPARDTIEKNQAWLAERLGILSYDAACKDFARLAFLVHYDDFKYLNLDLLKQEPTVRLNNNVFNPDSLPPSWSEAPLLCRDKSRVVASNSDIQSLLPQGGGDEAGENDNAVTRANPGSPSLGGGGGRPPQSRQFNEEQMHFCFHGMLISDIAQRYLDYFGRPMEGERNTYYYNMCVNFRYITDHNVGILLAQLPDLGLSITERQRVVESACKSRRGGRIPYTFWKFLESLGLVTSLKNAGLATTEEEQEEQLDSMEKKKPTAVDMPMLFREICRSVPLEFRWPMTAALLPILGTLGSRIRARYIDGKMHSPTFHSVIIAPASSGKSIFGDIYHLLTEQLKRRDDVEWEREKLYKMELRRKKNAKELPENPHIRLRLLNPSISVPMLLQRQQDADGLHQLTFTPEVDTLAKTNKGKAGMDKNDMYRQAWDNDWYGQDYMMTDTFSGNVQLFQNFLLTGTPAQVRNFYGDPENGLVSRVMFAHIEGQEFARMPKFRELTARAKETIDRCIQRLLDSCYKTLDNGKETILAEKDITEKMTFMYKPLEDWLEKKRLEALMEADKSKDNFRKRAAVKAFRAAMLAVEIYVSPSKYQQAMIVQWAIDLADKDLKEHIDMYADKFNEDQAPVEFTIANILRSLDDHFTMNDVIVAMKRAGRKSQASGIVSGWKTSGLVVKTGKGQYQKTALGKEQ